MKPHYFNQDKADTDDILLSMSISQGYVPHGCLLGGIVVMDEIKKGLDPCAGCAGPREKCEGRPKNSVVKEFFTTELPGDNSDLLFDNGQLNI